MTSQLYQVAELEMVSSIEEIVGKYVRIDPKTVHWYMNPMDMDQPVRLKVTSVGVVRNIKAIPYRYNRLFSRGEVFRLEGDILDDQRKHSSIRRECWFVFREADIRLDQPILRVIN